MSIKFINDAYTTDELRLPMVHFESDKKDICIIFIHGMCQTIIDNYFAVICGENFANNNIGFLYEHNRSSFIDT